MTRLLPAVLVLLSPLVACFADAPSALSLGDDDDDDASSGGDTTGDDGSSSNVGTTAMSGSGSNDPTVDTTTASSTDADPETSDGSDATGETTADESSTGEPENVLRDLAMDACDAAWTNDLGDMIPCPPLEFQGETWPLGHVYRATDAPIAVETLGELIADDAIITHPRFTAEGQIVGTFVAEVYPAGAELRATIACAAATACEVMVFVASRSGDAHPEPIAIEMVRSDDVEGVDIVAVIPTTDDPTELSLTIASGGVSASDTVVWLRPRIVVP